MSRERSNSIGNETIPEEVHPLLQDPDNSSFSRRKFLEKFGQASSLALFGAPLIMPDHLPDAPLTPSPEISSLSKETDKISPLNALTAGGVQQVL